MEIFVLFKIFNFKVPDDYDKTLQIEMFVRSYGEQFDFIHPLIVDENFERLSAQLNSGSSYVAKIYEPTRLYRTDEADSFSQSQRSVMSGPQAQILAWPYLNDDFPEGKNLISFGGHPFFVNKRFRLAVVERKHEGRWRFALGHVETKWSKNNYLLCVCEVGA